MMYSYYKSLEPTVKMIILTLVRFVIKVSNLVFEAHTFYICLDKRPGVCFRGPC